MKYINIEYGLEEPLTKNAGLLGNIFGKSKPVLNKVTEAWSKTPSAATEAMTNLADAYHIVADKNALEIFADNEKDIKEKKQ